MYANFAAARTDDAVACEGSKEGATEDGRDDAINGK
jgi:hypothetical protein